MKKIITITLIFLSVSIITAQKSPFEELDIAIWPEYDHPGVLVLMDGTFHQEALPITLEFRIPDEAGTVGATFAEGDEEISFEVVVEERDDGKWAVMEIAKGSKKLRTGFYYDPFTDSVERNIDYLIELNQPLEHFHIQVQKPLTAESFRNDDPTAEKTGDPSHGFTNYTILVNGLAAGEQKRISFSYQNPSGKLSMEVLQQMMAAEPSSSSGDDSSLQTSVNEHDESFKHTMPTWQPLLILSTVALIVGVVYATQNKRLCPTCKTPNSGRSKFCSSCGSNLS
jgi:hypothetical protein